VLEAIIFDMDGVLVDSEQFIRQAAVNMFAEKGVSVDADDFLPFTGTGENRFIGGVAGLYGISIDLEKDKARLYAIYGELIVGNLEPLDGVVDFIAHCRKNGWKLSVASSADDIKVDQNLNGIGIPRDQFDAVTTGSDVTRTKPDPDIFLITAKKMGVHPGNCLVIEDAVSGVTAAKAAGCRCLALTTSFSPEALHEADWIGKTLADFPKEAIEW